MENNQNKREEIIDVRQIIIKLWARKMLFIKVLAVAFVLSVAWILPEPRTYTVDMTLAPEMSSMSGGGALGDLASSFGFDLGSMQSADAIYPTLYPDIMKSKPFIVSLFDIKVKNLDGDIDTTYYHYLDKKQKSSFWKYPINLVKRTIAQLTAEPEKAPAGGEKSSAINPFFMSKRQNEIIKNIQERIKCTVDKKTEVITITVTDQDRLICATMADSVSAHLQDYIIDYRTKKARVDVEYYEKLLHEAKVDYAKALGVYSGFTDSHFDAILESTTSKREALNNDVQAKLLTLNTVTAQLQQAKARLQERTPSFTTIECASVPTKPTGPKRMIFVIGMMMVAFIMTSLWVVRKDLGFYYDSKE